MKAKKPQSTFGQGAFPQNSKVASSQTVVVPTTTVSVPPNRYGKAPKRKKRA